MMRWLLTIICALIVIAPASAQITITANDMPVRGDSLRYSNASATGAMAFISDSGADITWNFALTPTSQGIDLYKPPGEVNPLFGFTINSPGCSGYKVADSIPGLGFIAAGITVTDMYTFFSKITTPPAYAAVAFGATISGFPVGANYTSPDPWYVFPLTYGNNDSSDFHLEYGVANFGGITQKGYRKTRVDGWGTITTPYITTPKGCIRLRSEIVEVDSVSLSGQSFGIPRTTIEYKWLVNGEHYPALWVTAISLGGAEIVTGVKFRDKYRPELNTKVKNLTADGTDVFAYPNPATNGWIRFEIPNSWTDFIVELFDVQGRLIKTFQTERQLDISMLPAGDYIARLTSGGTTAYIKITK